MSLELLPGDLSALTWISPSLVANCPDESFRAGILKLADKTIELTEGSMVAYVARANLLVALGRHEQALADYEKFIELDPDNPGVCNNAAWSIARYPGMKTELIEYAVVLAQKAVKLESKKKEKGMYANTLGVAQYRAGNWLESIDALQKSDQLLKGDYYSFNGFFLSMAHRQLGDKNTALEWYKKSVLWMQKNMPDNEQHIEELIRFRAEAEQLLGIPAAALKPELDQEGK